MDVDEQWARVLAYSKTASSRLEDDSPLRYLRSQWRAMTRADLAINEPAESWRRNGYAVLDACINFVADGTYPPPELMFVLMECWAEYVGAPVTPGRDLERIMFGPPAQKAGNFAKRNEADRRNRVMAMTFYAGICAGKTRNAAASATHQLTLIEWPDDTPSVASILDMFRWIKRTTDFGEIMSGRVRRTRKRRMGKFG